MKLRKIAALGLMAYGALQNPMVREALIKGADQLSAYLRKADTRQASGVAPFTGKPAGQAPAAETKLSEKLPTGSLGKAANVVDAAREKVVAFDAKESAKGDRAL